MDKSTKNIVQPSAPAPESSPESERRRIGKVVHDKRGNALVEWVNAPSDYERPVLEIVEDGRSERADENTFNPYARKVPRRPSTGNTTRTDLRKLSEWIKQMRELEERRRKGEAAADRDDAAADQDSED